MTINHSGSFTRALNKEIPLWVKDGVIPQELASNLQAMYPVPESGRSFITIVSILGSVLVGLGVILFVGANWHAMASLTKLCIICCAIVLTNALAFILNAQSKHSKVSSALFLLGGLFYGAGIWLISQTYQMDLDWSLGLSLWSFGLIPMALTTKNVPLIILNSLVLLLWTFSEQPFWLSLSVLALAITLSYVFKSRCALVISLIQGTIVWYCGLNQNLTGSLMQAFIYAITIFVWSLWHRQFKPLFANCYLSISLCLGFFSVYMTTFDTRLFKPDNHEYLPLTVLFVTAIASIVYVFETVKDHRNEIIIGFLMIPLMILITNAPERLSSIYWAFKLLANLTLFSSLLALIYAGARRLESALTVNLCTAFFALAVLTRYFDTFFAMLNRSIFFIVGGLILLGGGYLLEQQRRTFVRRIAHD